MSGARGRDRRDVGAAELGVKAARRRLRADRREHAERQRDPTRRRVDDAQRQDRRGAEHRRRGTADPGRRAGARRLARTSADAIVDLATLTGACVVALGEKIAGLMGEPTTRGSSRSRSRPTGRASRMWPLPAARATTASCSTPRSPTCATSAPAARRGPHRRAVPARVRRRRRRGLHLDIAGPARAGADDGELTTRRHRLRRAHAPRAGQQLRRARRDGRGRARPTKTSKAKKTSRPRRSVAPESTGRSRVADQCDAARRRPGRVGQAQVVVLGDHDLRAVRPHAGQFGSRRTLKVRNVSSSAS